MNSRNRKARKNNTTGVAGVTIRKRKDGSIVYRASISSDNGKVLLGTFYSLEDAAKARKEAELKYWGFNIGE
nr:MAG TPA: ethylene-responsive transcription factor [Caudoviricetes sp.]